MDLRQLEYFLAVAGRRNITAAATELNVTQPTLTKSIKLLEDELGVPLFERLPRGVELSAFGRILLRHAQAVHVQIKDAGEEIAALRGGALGSVTIGAGPAWLRRHLPLATARVIARHPKAHIRVDGGFDEALFRSLRHGELDFVVAELPSPEDRRDLEVMPLTSDSLGICCRQGHPLAGRRKVALADLLKFPWAMPPRTTRAQRRLSALFVAHDLPPPTSTVETGSLAFLLNVLHRSDAVTYTVSKTLVTRDGADLVMLNVPEITATREAGVVTRRGAWLSPIAATVIEELKEICAAEPQN
jgi:LysR family transcriptional regulator of gallate degradation